MTTTITDQKILNDLDEDRIHKFHRGYYEDQL